MEKSFRLEMLILENSYKNKGIIMFFNSQVLMFWDPKIHKVDNFLVLKYGKQP
jgi:hypothetical protein